MDQNTAPIGTVAHLGRPGNDQRIVKTGSSYWIHVNGTRTGRSVDPEGFRSGWHVITIPLKRSDMVSALPSNTTYGRWIKRRIDEHRCLTPPLDSNSDVSEGDEWRCNYCYGVWLVEYAQRDGYYWHTGKPIRFEKKPSFSI